MNLLISVDCSVRVIPSPYVITRCGGDANVRCIAVGNGVTDFLWYLNGSDLRAVQDQPNLITNVTNFFEDGSSVSLLTMSNIPKIYNTTNIRCAAVFSPSNRIPSNTFTLLLLEGKLKQL